MPRATAFPLLAGEFADARRLLAPAQRHQPMTATITDFTPMNQMQLEAIIAETWQEVLGVQAGADDNFFALGGNSIRAAQVANRIQARIQRMLPPGVLFAAPTIRTLSRELLAQTRAFAREGAAVDDGRVADAQIEAARAHLAQRNSGNNVGIDTASPRHRPAAFILAPPRSGSTLLRAMLAGHPRLFCPPELYLLSFDRLRQRRERFSGQLGLFRDGLIRGLMALKPCSREEADALMADWEARDLSTRDCWGLLLDWAGSRLIVDKTPSYAYNPRVLARAEAEFDQARFIHLTRHPLGTLQSFHSLNADTVLGDLDAALPYGPRQKGELWWLIGHQHIRAFLAGIPSARRLQCSYEDLVRDPRGIMERICAFLGLPLHADMLDPYGDPAGRMTDGLGDGSVALGDPKFHGYRGIDPAAAERWRADGRPDLLCDATRTLAAELGYDDLGDGAREDWEI